MQNNSAKWQDSDDIKSINVLGYFCQWEGGGVEKQIKAQNISRYKLKNQD